jgi:hypothetical protein
MPAPKGLNPLETAVEALVAEYGDCAVIDAA